MRTNSYSAFLAMMLALSFLLGATIAHSQTQYYEGFFDQCACYTPDGIGIAYWVPAAKICRGPITGCFVGLNELCNMQCAADPRGVPGIESRLHISECGPCESYPNCPCYECSPDGDPLFFHDSISVTIRGERGETIIADFSPKNGCTLDEVAQASGFHHFNWINVVTQIPPACLVLCGEDLTLPLIDPSPGRTCSGKWADNLPYYWDEVNQEGSAANSQLNTFRSATSLFFGDTPTCPLASLKSPIKFYTALVGVRYGASYTVLSSFLWQTTNNRPDPAAGAQPLQEVNFTDPGGGAGGIIFLGEDINPAELPLAVRQLLAQRGAHNMPLPSSEDLDGDGVAGDIDNCQAVPNSGQTDSDQDLVGDECDNCPQYPNPDQRDEDGDTFGDACDTCPALGNPGQEDADQDGTGTACDCNDNDPGITALIGYCSATDAVGPFDFYTVSPCRVVDTRWSAGHYGGPPLASGDLRAFTIVGRCGIPATAKAITGNVAVVNAGASGYLTFFPGDGELPLASTINFQAAQTRANNAILALALSGTGSIAVQCTMGGGSVHLIVDVNGYFQ